MLSFGPDDSEPSAAKWTEQRGIQLVGLEEGEPPPQYDGVSDSFVPTGAIPEPPGFENTLQKLPQVRETLNKMHQLIREKKLDVEHGITLKNPSQYTTGDIESVLHIAEQVTNNHQHATDGKEWIPKLRRFARRLGHNAEAAKSLIEYIPDNEYTSVVCGCLTVIVTTSANIRTVRRELYIAMAEIPDKMDLLCGYTNHVHINDPGLRRCADLVYAEILAVLEVVIKEFLTSGLKKFTKALVQASLYPRAVREVLENMEQRMKAFKAKVQFLDSKRSADSHNRINDTHVVVKETITRLCKMDSEISEVKLQVSAVVGQLGKLVQVVENKLKLDKTQSSESNNSMIQKLVVGLQSAANLLEAPSRSQSMPGLKACIDQLQTEIQEALAFDDGNNYRGDILGLIERIQGKLQETKNNKFQPYITLNHLYNLAIASPSYNSRTGRANKESPNERGIFAYSPRQRLRALQTIDTTAELVEEWTKKLDHPRRTALEDMQQCSDWITDATLAEQDQTKWLVTSPAIRTWLTGPGSRILLITAETPPDSTLSPLSYAVAALAQSLLKSQWFPVITYICGLRSWQPELSDNAAALAMLASLAGQLLEEIHEKMPNIQYPALVRRKYGDAFGSLPGVIALLKDLLKKLDHGTTVFVLIDSLSQLESRDQEGSQTAMDGLCDIMSVAEIPIKVVVTDSLYYEFSSDLRPEIEVVHLPDDAEGDLDGYHSEEERLLSWDADGES